MNCFANDYKVIRFGRYGKLGLSILSLYTIWVSLSRNISEKPFLHMHSLHSYTPITVDGVCDSDLLVIVTFFCLLHDRTSVYFLYILPFVLEDTLYNDYPVHSTRDS